MGGPTGCPSRDTPVSRAAGTCGWPAGLSTNGLASWAGAGSSRPLRPEIRSRRGAVRVLSSLRPAVLSSPFLLPPRARRGPAPRPGTAPGRPTATRSERLSWDKNIFHKCRLSLHFLKNRFFLHPLSSPTPGLLILNTHTRPRHPPPSGGFRDVPMRSARVAPGKVRPERKRSWGLNDFAREGVSGEIKEEARGREIGHEAEKTETRGGGGARALVSGHRVLHSSYCWKLAPSVLSIQPQLRSTGMHVGPGAGRLPQPTALGSGLAR